MGNSKVKPEVHSVIEKAEKLIRSKSYRKAIEELEKNSVRSVDYFLLLAEAYEALGESEKAELFFEEARFLDTEIRSREKLQRGITLASVKNFSGAEKELKECIRLNPFEKQAYYELYRLYREMGNRKGMVEVLNLLLTVDPFSSYPYIELSRLYSFRRQYYKAAKVLEEALEVVDLPEIHFELGKVYADMGRLEEAREELSEACRQDFGNVEYRQKLAEILVNGELYEEALDVVLSTLELFPDAVYVLQSAAALYDLIGDEELAEYYYRKAVANADGFLREDALKFLAEFFSERGKFDQAEEILREIIETTDNPWILIDAFSDLSIILLEQERFSDIAELGKAVVNSPDLTEEEVCEISEIVADALYEEKKFEEALVWYKKVFEISCNNKLTKRAYSRIKEIEEILSLERMVKS